MTAKRAILFGVGLILVIWIGYLMLFSESARLEQASGYYKQGQWEQARAKCVQLTQPSFSYYAQGMGHFWLAEMALQEQDFETAETEVVLSLVNLQQARQNYHLGQTLDLQRAAELQGLIALAPFLHLSEAEFLYHGFLTSAKVVDPINQAQEMGSQRFKLLIGVRHNRPGFARWREFVQNEALYQRLRRVAVPVPVVQTPGSQAPVREVIQRWQAVKAEAFLNYNPEVLQTVLTGPALEGTLQAVQWWVDTPDAFYRRLELESLRFLRVDYTSPTTAKAVVEIAELRENSKEGLQKEKYQVEYTVVKMGEKWWVNALRVRS